jgi:hypothetical protein
MPVAAHREFSPDAEEFGRRAEFLDQRVSIIDAVAVAALAILSILSP